MSRNMTIPSRPAPPPPQGASNKITRYSPATNWDDTPFGASQSSTTTAINNGRQQQQQQTHLSHLGGNQFNAKQRKAPPPRPPPPKLVPALKKPGQPQSINILSSLFGQKRNHGTSKPGNTSSFGGTQKGQIQIKLPPPPKQPPPLSHQSGSNYGSTASTASGGFSAGTDAQLINFDSPPSSPTFTQKSCSDCISVDSFSSDSNYSSPNNGSMSQAESGFEDDFVSQSEHTRSKTATPALSTNTTPAGIKDLWDMSDPFSMPPPVVKPNSVNIYAPVGSATIRAPAVNSKLYESDYIDPLCNGKSIASKVQTVSMPTIIKPSTGSNSSSQKSTPVHSVKQRLAVPVQQSSAWPTSKPPASLPSAMIVPPSNSRASAAGTCLENRTSFEDCEESLDSLPSLPMPNIPPPPPPSCLDTEDLETLSALAEDQCKQPYGIAMYDFNGQTDEDLNFKTNDKIYLLKRLNEEWLLGRDRRGCEGMFPANYIEVRVPLPGERLLSSSPNVACATTSRSDISNSGTNSFNHPKVQILYTFNAEAAEDLTLLENQYVTVLYQITSEWLYGESNGQRGQFPANFIEYVPPNLPPMPANINDGV